ncbi:hypothetical protein CHARACLAT_025726 [Characodon lateralis]|uniref:Ribonuclease A-domain domain-containing protein n=1 Tax=Characodon lateralis TaxID=208331 RepID=A0ABU7EQI1_9TELE|nr:hypothetical protein [Characodon lateralis]
MKTQIVAVLLLALSATEISWALDFFQKHVVKEMEPGDCNDNMRAINKNIKKCKTINTFFLDPQRTLDQICMSGKSQQTVDINLRYIDCHRCQDNYPDCTYNHAVGQAIKVTVSCNEKREPDHLAEVVKVQENNG